jgi:hypothetical protein
MGTHPESISRMFLSGAGSAGALSCKQHARAAELRLEQPIACNRAIRSVVFTQSANRPPRRKCKVEKAPTCILMATWWDSR